MLNKGRIGVICKAAFGIAFCVPATIHAATALRSQTSELRHPPSHPRDLPPSGGGPFAAMPNYAGAASAGDFELRHWRQPEVTFRVTPSKNDKWTPDQVKALALQGISLWKDKISAKLTLRMMEPTDGKPDVEISFVPDGTLPSGRCGETTVFHEPARPPKNDIGHVTIRIVEGLSSDELVQAIAHECGHAFDGFDEDVNQGVVRYTSGGTGPMFNRMNLKQIPPL